MIRKFRLRHKDATTGASSGEFNDDAKVHLYFKGDRHRAIKLVQAINDTFAVKEPTQSTGQKVLMEIEDREAKAHALANAIMNQLMTDEAARHIGRKLKKIEPGEYNDVHNTVVSAILQHGAGK